MPKKRVVIIDEDTCFSIFEETGDRIYDTDFKSEKKAKKFCKRNDWKIVEELNVPDDYWAKRHGVCN